MDSARGIAALLVVLFHVSLASGSQRGFVGGELLGQLDVGVAIFFALSGFLLYRPFIAERRGGARPPRVGVYGKRRALRIFPAFAVAFAGYALYPGLAGLSDNWWVYGGLLQSFTFLYEPEVACGAAFCGLQHAWTITAELTFYALLPAYVLLTALARRRGGDRGWLRAEAGAGIAVLAMGILTYVLFLGDPEGRIWLAISLPGVGLWFAAGVGLAVVSVLAEGWSRDGVDPPPRAAAAISSLANRPALWIGGAIAVMAVLAALTPPSGTDESLAGILARWVGFGLAALLFLAPLAFAGHRRRATRTHRALEHPAARWLGLVSYGTYLWHVAVVHALLNEADMFRLFPGTGALALLAVAGVACSLAAGAASYYLVERPFLRYKHRPLPRPWARRGDGGRAAGNRAPEVVAAPPGNPRFELIDSLRAIAALSIAVVHATIAAGAYNTTWVGREIVGHLALAVPLFFAISGFLLYRPFISPREGGPRLRVSGYAWRRILRLVPGLWAALIAYQLISNQLGSDTRVPDLDLFGENWWVYFGLLGGQDFLFDPVTACGAQFCFFGATWSLGVEAMLYVLLPVYMVAMRRLAAHRTTGQWLRLEAYGLGALGLATIAAAAYYAGGNEHLTWLNYNPATHALPFLCGMGLAVASVAIRAEGRAAVAERIGSAANGCWIAAAALFAVIVALVPQYGSLLTVEERLVEYILGSALVTLILAPVVFRARRDRAPHRLLANPVLSWIGLISYGIFLWHSATIAYLVEAGAITWIPGAGTYVLLGLTMVTAIMAGAISYYLIERPFLRLKRLTWRPGLRRGGGEPGEGSPRPDTAPETAGG